MQHEGKLLVRAKLKYMKSEIAANGFSLVIRNFE